MTKPVQFNVRKLRQPSQILRKAAEIIQHDLKTRNYHPDYCASLGGCAAMDDVEDALYEKLDANYSYTVPARLATALNTLERSRELFRVHFGYKDTAKRSIQRNGYWFGTKFTDAEQQHRIDALLFTAEVAEAQGE